jgi:hypothetical protein
LGKWRPLLSLIAFQEWTPTAWVTYLLKKLMYSAVLKIIFDEGLIKDIAIF